jgi:5-methylcytosine-specific restriction endonuclease McrA
MKFQLEVSLRHASDEEVLDDLRRCAKFLNTETISTTDYRQHGAVSQGTIIRRFGSWNAALAKAGLKVKVQRNISDKELFENIKQMWIHLGRQPKYAEVRAPFSKFSNVTYDKRFGKFSEALKKFVEWVNQEGSECPQEESMADKSKKRDDNIVAKKRTKREISERQRFRILVRDGFQCQACGASPLKERGVDLHVDHILPWSKGGETVDENLQTKCQACNLGKGNAFSV